MEITVIDYVIRGVNWPLDGKFDSILTVIYRNNKDSVKFQPSTNKVRDRETRSRRFRHKVILQR